MIIKDNGFTIAIIIYFSAVRIHKGKIENVRESISVPYTEFKNVFKMFNSSLDWPDTLNIWNMLC